MLLLLVVIVIALVGVVSVAVDVPTAMRVLAVALLAFALIRLGDHANTGPLAVRGRLIDATLLCAAAVVVFALAPAGQLS